jgi:hypothetical protein
VSDCRSPGRTLQPCMHGNYRPATILTCDFHDPSGRRRPERHPSQCSPTLLITLSNRAVPRAARTTSPPHSTLTPGIRPRPGGSGGEADAEARAPAEAHASPPRTGCAHPLSCGEADDPGEADWHYHSRIRSVSVVRVGATCLPHPALRGSLRVGGRGGARGGCVAALPRVVLVLVSERRCAGEVVGKLPRSAWWFPAGVVTLPVVLHGRRLDAARSREECPPYSLATVICSTRAPSGMWVPSTSRQGS